MAKALVKLPVGVILPGMPASLQCEGATVGEALADCVAQEPRLQKRIFRPDGTPWVGVSVNGRSLPPEAGLDDAIADGDEIRLLPSVGAC
jgi:molybdopterin converting factor small subunit